ncbi:MAG: acyl dehydratase [Myxococcota bacterium]|jgi:acyl dehydratase
MAAKIALVRHQIPVLKALGSSLLDAALGRKRPATAIPGPELVGLAAAHDHEHIQTYVAATGGDPGLYGDTVPAHMFSQWCYPTIWRSLAGIPYPLSKALNGGCRLTMNGPIPSDTPLKVAAQLESIDDNGRRARIHQRITTGPGTQQDAVVVDFFPVVPFAKKDRNTTPGAGAVPKRAPATVPEDAREVARWALTPGTALDYAMLTGDFNPIHWIKLAAKVAGFKSTILHGFGILAHAIEGLNLTVLDGDPTALKTIDVRFTKPVTLPMELGLFVTDGEDGVEGVYIGKQAGGLAHMLGTFERR